MTAIQDQASNLAPVEGNARSNSTGPTESSTHAAEPNSEAGINQRRPRTAWIRRSLKIAGFFAGAGFLILPVTELLEWLKEDTPPFITQLSCEVAAYPDASGLMPPPLDPTQKIVIQVGERLVCGVDQEGGDFLVWRGGGNGYHMRSGPAHSDQERNWQERVRGWFDETTSAQITACVAPLKPVSENSVPACRHVIAYSVSGSQLLTVRVLGRGSSHVEEASLPIQVVETGTVLKLDEITIVPPANIRFAERVGNINETLNAPKNPLSGAKTETRRISMGRVEPGEAIVPGSANVIVHSTNGADIRFEYTPQELFAVVQMRSGPGFDQRRAWISAEVRYRTSFEARQSVTTVEKQYLRTPSRRLIYSQPVTPESKVSVGLSAGEKLETALNQWIEVDNQQVRFLSTADGLVAETRMK